MSGTRPIRVVRATAAGALIAALLGTIGCSDQYADYGKVDVGASKKAAEENGIKKFETPPSKGAKGKGSSRRGQAPVTEKPSAPASRGLLPR